MVHAERVLLLISALIDSFLMSLDDLVACNVFDALYPGTIQLSLGVVIAALDAGCLFWLMLTKSATHMTVWPSQLTGNGELAVVYRPERLRQVTLLRGIVGPLPPHTTTTLISEDGRLCRLCCFVNSWRGDAPTCVSSVGMFSSSRVGWPVVVTRIGRCS